MRIVRCITLWQPWASLVGLKKNETRHWSTQWRGWLAIHAAQRPVVGAEVEVIYEAVRCQNTDPKLIQQLDQVLGDYLAKGEGLPLGQIVTLTKLVDCLEMWDSTVYGPLMPPDRRGIDIASVDPLEKAVGNWQEGRFAWKFDDFISLPTPIPAQGRQRLWPPTMDVTEQLNTVMGSRA
ncbi:MULTISPECIES: hypothetical protein [Trichocoleus]|uniref:ASCH domain-containing protein n=1 Tax=Trichocoleus desertorum GB2-A4 TaxID=2933944 RepID=A0ABV0JCK9_9CYAN|nr:hypothetical protein [Trichocoleus sp. FACHB-46]MBD1864167.1 hypothetical protein [Trichocoleus sp. FACHB-46]